MGHRLLRVNEALKEVISRIIAGSLMDPRLGFITVTGVKASPDLRHAQVYVSVLGNATQHESSMEALRAAHGYIQSRLSDELRLKRTPQLDFIYDNTTDKAMRITTYMDKYLQEHPVPPPDPNAPEADGEEGTDTIDASEPTTGPDDGEETA